MIISEAENEININDEFIIPPVVELDSCCLTNSATFSQKDNLSSHNNSLDKDGVIFGIDTVRLRFLLSKENFNNYIKRKIEENIKYLDEDDSLTFCTSYICENIYGQNVTLLDNDDTYKVFIDFSLPKFFYSENFFKVTFSDLDNYITDYILPWSLNSEKELFLNRIDFAIQYSFNTISEAQSFERFLRKHRISNYHTKSNDDYCFWQMSDRCVRFYDKTKDFYRHKKQSNEFDNYDDYCKYIQWFEYYYNDLKNKNIYRLEFEYKADWLRKKFSSLRYFHLRGSLFSFSWFSQFKKDFSILDRKEIIIEKDRLDYSLEILKKNLTGYSFNKYLAFLFCLDRFDYERAVNEFFPEKKIYKLPEFERKFTELTGFTFLQILEKEEVCLFFPDKVYFPGVEDFTSGLPVTLEDRYIKGTLDYSRYEQNFEEKKIKRMSRRTHIKRNVNRKNILKRGVIYG